MLCLGIICTWLTFQWTSVVAVIVFRRVVMSPKSLSILNCISQISSHYKSVFCSIVIYKCRRELLPSSKIADQINIELCLLLLIKWGLQISKNMVFKVLLWQISPALPCSLFLFYVFLKKRQLTLPVPALHFVIFTLESLFWPACCSVELKLQFDEQAGLCFPKPSQDQHPISRYLWF